MRAVETRVYFQHGVYFFNTKGGGPHFYPGIGKNGIGLWFGFLR